MFVCNDCGKVFEEFEIKIVKEHHPYGIGYATEGFGYCPYCNSADFDEGKRCSRCGEYVTDTTDGLCDVCYEDMYE